jgi:integrase
MTEITTRERNETREEYDECLEDFEDYLSIWSESKIESCLLGIVNLLTLVQKRPSELTESDYMGIIRHLVSQGVSMSYLAVHKNAIREFSDFMEEKKGVDIPPPDDIDLQEYKGRVRPETDRGSLTKEEVRKLVKAAPRLRNALIIKLLYSTGVRRDELASIKLDDINSEDRIIDIREGKGNKFRRVPYPQSLDRIMRMWVGRYRDGHPNAKESEYLFPGEDLDGISGDSIRRIVHETAREAGVQEKIGEQSNGNTEWKVTVHCFRRTAATHWYREEDVDIAYIKEILGHESVEQTMEYIGISEKVALEECRCLDI